MARREKFGKLVLLAERDSGDLGVEYHAARLSPQGLDRLVSVLRFSPEVSSHPEATARLTEEARSAARLHNPALLRLLGVGRVGTSFYVSYELVEGRSLRVVIDRCRQEGFPFSAESALMVASRAASALEYVHDRKDADGQARFHGLLTPHDVVVAYDGEVKVKGLGAWASLHDTGLLGEEARRYLAPEQVQGGLGDRRSDIHALGLLLFEMLTLRRPEGDGPEASLERARLPAPGGELVPLPDPVLEVLRPALAVEPAGRYADMGEMRRAVDALLFSGELSSTTFNLAFFMHTLFRQEMEREAQDLEEARRADYAGFLASPASVASALAPAGPAEAGAPAAAENAHSTLDVGPSPTESPERTLAAVTEPLPTESPAPTEPMAAAGPEPPGPIEDEPRPDDSSAERLTPPGPSDSSAGRLAAPSGDRLPSDGSGSVRALRGRSSRSSATRGAARLSFGRASAHSAGRWGLALAVSLVLAVSLGGGAGYLYYVRQTPAVVAPPTTTLSPEAAAALRRVRELEARIAELENEKAKAEQQEEETTVPATAPATPTANAQAEAQERARAEARRRARIEKLRREAEILRLEEEKRAAEARLVDEQRAAFGASAEPPALPSVAPPPPTPAPPVTTLPPVERGALVDAGDPELVAPVLVHERRVSYPPAAQRAHQEASVVVEALVDEKGGVVEAFVVEPSGFRLGFEEAAIAQVKGRRYQAGTKRGVPVKVRVRVRVNFTL